MSITLVGRDEELRSIEAFLERVEAGPTGLVLSGEPGIGKTILWEAAVEQCRRNSRVLSCRCLETEASLSFGGLSDLVGSAFEEVAPSLPVPRRHALEVALLLSEPGDQPVNPRAIGLGLLDVVRALADRAPLVIAVDDLHWLDSSTSRVLLMALRRLSEERVGFLATVREARDVRIPFELERPFPEEWLSRLSLRPLSLGALHRLLRERLGLELTRPELVRLGEATAGNPFFALELGRERVRIGARLEPRKPLPVPARLGALFEQRLERLPEETRAVLLAVAALDRPTVETVAAAHTEPRRVHDALAVAAREGVIGLDGSRIRFAHPLLASACYEHLPLWQRRETHKALAAVVKGDEERVRHLALAATGEDAALAADLDAVAIAAEARGASAAAELLELAAELTPSDQAEEWRRRRLQAAWEYLHAGDSEHGATIMEQLLAEARPGGERSDVLFQLAWVRHPADLRARVACFEEALREAAGDDCRAALILASRAGDRLSHDPSGALVDARAGLEKAERIEQPPLPETWRRHDLRAPAFVLATAIARLAYVETCTLAVTPGLLERGLTVEAPLTAASHFMYWNSPTAILAHRLMLRDNLEHARAILERKEAELKSDWIRGSALLHLTVLEWLSGRWRRALEHGAEALDLAEQVHGDLGRIRALQPVALVEAHLGCVDDARAKAEEALEKARAASDEITAIESVGVLGHLELALGNVEVAAGYLRLLPGRLVTLGWNDPSSPLWPDAIETLIRYGELAGARTCVEQYEERAQRASRRSLACAARCRGLLAAAEGDLPAAFEAFDRALGELAALPYPFERARTLLALGQVLRQARQRRAGREALERSLAIFEELEARLWVKQARSELKRISGRPAGSEQLTETEQRVASLAGQGLSNKEIAAALFMSVHTVEAHLTHVYRKLGVKSRAALAHRLAAAANDAAKV